MIVSYRGNECICHFLHLLEVGQCHSSLSVTVLAVGLTVLTVVLTITSTFTLLFIWKKSDLAIHN